MDAAFKPCAYPSVTIGELRAYRSHGTANAAMLAELSRREAVERGDYSNSTAAERMRAVKAGIPLTGFVMPDPR